LNVWRRCNSLYISSAWVGRPAEYMPFFIWQFR
jgi:hypothetical protein